METLVPPPPTVSRQTRWRKGGCVPLYQIFPRLLVLLPSLSAMYVKSEPDCDFDMAMEMMTDMETNLLREELFGNHCIPSDVSESSSDDDLIHKLSSDLEIPLALDDLEPGPPWPCQPGEGIFHAIPTGSTSPTSSSSTNSIKCEVSGDMTAEELTRALYPNLVASPGHDLHTVDTGGGGGGGGGRVKDEPASPQHLVHMPPSPDNTQDIWELLCGSDVKPSVKVLDTPPVTPPQSEASPPHSPQPPSPISMVVSSSQQKNSLSRGSSNLSQPIKVVTITTRNGGTSGPTKGGRITKTMKIQPKVVSTAPAQAPPPPPQVISIVNSSSVPKLTLPKTTVTRTIPASNTRIVQVKASPTSGHLSPPTAPITSPITSILSPQVNNSSPVVSPTPAAPLTPLAPALAPGMKQGSIPDLKAFKRQQRMIKNRESASLSRKKKKEYLTSLETSITDLQKENQKLKEENLRLQQRVATLETECSNLRHSLGRTSNRKTTTALFALIFLFSLNFGPLTGILLGGESKLSSLKNMMQGNDVSSVPAGFSQRSLLWSRNEMGADEGGSSSSQLATNASHTCPMYINATESLRLETELRDWFEHKFRPSKNERKKDDSLATSPLPKAREGRKGLAGKVRKGVVKGAAAARRNSDSSSGGGREGVSEVWNALAPPQPPPAHLYHYVHPDALHVKPPSRPEGERAMMATAPRLSSFLEAIQRRDDTYYVVSFSPDHLLVPATARNDSARPRMSLLMPTPRPINDSLTPPRDHIAMMQIDCEVMHTRLVHVSEEFIPAHLRAGGSNASHPAPSPSEDSHAEQEEPRRRARPRPSLPNSTHPTK